MDTPRIVAVIGPTASGKSSRAVSRALHENGEVISVDSRQVYRMLDIGTEKIRTEEMQGIPHHLIDIRDPKDPYSAGDFVKDATRLITEIIEQGKLPILAGGTHFYFDALINGLPPNTPPSLTYRQELEAFTNEELHTRIRALDSVRADALDPQNRRRLIRALEILNVHDTVPERATVALYDVDWDIVAQPRDILRERIDARLKEAFARGLVDEVRRVREHVGDERLTELGLEYRIVGEYLRNERDEASLMPALSAKLWQYAKRQMMWIRKLSS